jgi:hypothetical protein
MLVEFLPINVRRKFDFDYAKVNIDMVVKDINRSINICDISVEDYIYRVCDMTVGDFFYTYEDEVGKDIHQHGDVFRSFLINMFEEYLRNKYNKRCN